MFIASIPINMRTRSLGLPGDIQARVARRFAKEAGELILGGIREVLGSVWIYQLSAAYAKRKPSVIGFRRFADKAPDQPLILTGQMYHALKVVPAGSGFDIVIDEADIDDHNKNYPQIWEERTQFAEYGLALVEDKLPDLLLDIAIDELGLN